MSEGLLVARDLTCRFGGLTAVDSVSLALAPGRLLGVIGANGAGKSTLINMLTGHQRPTHGQVLIDGKDFTGARPFRITHAGVARTFQIAKPFRGMTVLDNVALGAMFGDARGRSVNEARRAAEALLVRVGLVGKGALHPSELSVADARGWSSPSHSHSSPLLLLDEVLAGLRPAEIDPALALIDSLRREGLALLMVEHLVRALSSVADELLVLHHGQVLTRGAVSEVLRDERVVAAYLGSRYAARQRARDARDVERGGP